MKRIFEYIKQMLSDIKSTFSRFALVPLLLASVTVMVSLLMENALSDDTRQNVEKLIFSAIAGVFFGIALEFLCERFTKLKAYRIYLQGVTLLFTALYYFLMTADIENNIVATIRLIVICFALFAFYLCIPSFKNSRVFSNNALAHFKAFFVSALYSLVLMLGVLAIYFAVDLLLVKLDSQIPGHIANVMGTFFFPLYYLALLPDFNSSDERMLEKCKSLSLYPRFLEILVSYIAMPLVTVFTVVLAIYMVKILVTFKWPVGQLGPMLLAYSAVGLFLYVLCGRLENRFSLFYRKYFPWALIPLVCLQLYSVFIRLNAYGITESRYYLVLFGIYSIVCAIVLILMKGSKPGMIAILAAVFAIISILPPIDAFTMSRASQRNRVETILVRNDMLSSGQIKPSSNLPAEDKIELTNIMNYLFRMGHTSKIEWLPADYNQYQDFQKVFGFNEIYENAYPEVPEVEYYNGVIDQKIPMDIAGYEVGLKAGFYQYTDYTPDGAAFELEGKTYRLDITYLDNHDAEFSIESSTGEKLVRLTLSTQLEKLAEEQKLNKGSLIPPSDLTIDAIGGDLKLRVILQTIGFHKDSKNAIINIEGEALILVGVR